MKTLGVQAHQQQLELAYHIDPAVPDLGIGADGEGVERDGAFLGPLGEGLGKQVQAGDEEEDALGDAGSASGGRSG